jgi:DedD protein
VILVPEILPGPVAGRSAKDSDPTEASEGPPLRTFSLELGANGRPAESDQSALAPQAAAPAPVAAESKPAATEGTRATSAQGKPESSGREGLAGASTEATTPTAKPPIADAPVPVPAGSWWVQLGSFSQAANAQRLVQTLGKAGFSAQMSPLRSKGKELYRVRAGPVGDRPAAEALRARLLDAGHKGTLVAP